MAHEQRPRTLKALNKQVDNLSSGGKKWDVSIYPTT